MPWSVRACGSRRSVGTLLLEVWLPEPPAGRGSTRVMPVRRAEDNTALLEARPILERLGFTAVTTTTPYVWSPTAASA